jgi:2-oxoglutarate decarboxylase
MLRLKTATSAAAEFTSGSFRPVLGDPALGTTGFDGQAPRGSGPLDATAVRRVLLCTGKFYYDLAERRRATGLGNVAIVRVERLYPRPAAEIAAELSRYPADAEIVWAQEEPANMGGWPYMGLKLPSVIGRPLGLISLPPSSAPAAGSAKAHAAEHAQLVDAALGLTG